jgi:hypothetical protein
MSPLGKRKQGVNSLRSSSMRYTMVVSLRWNGF